MAVLISTGNPISAQAQVQAHSGEDRCTDVNLTTPPSQPVRIRYGLTGGGEEPLALLWADKENYAGNGRFYQLEPQKYASNDRMTAVQAGQLDAGSISLTALITSVRVGVDLRAVASIVETSEQDNQGAFVAMRDSGIDAAAQFKNKRIGFYGPNTISEYWIKSALRRAGLNPAEARYVSLPPPAQEQALRNQQIDVAWLSRQFLAKAEKTGGIKVALRPMQATEQAHPSTLVFFTRQFVDAHPQAFCAWRNDYQKALQNWRGGRPELYAKLIAANYLTPAAADAGPDGGRAEGGRINVGDVQATIKDMVGVGFLPAARTVPAEDLLMKGYALRR
ncbi:ABC transporter substrate-binding protein [Xylophilus sp. ASV27]|uniref:ABC transporter substrate-binding protein n=1 Tax=Xylophilus sp. ASV27 TaxID=2795129 RepID=UPI0018EDEC1E|nr:ABC transporter substrate-binding protein [Xylophilus sp. ASV27]